MSKTRSFSDAVEEAVAPAAEKFMKHDLQYVPLLKGKAGELGALKNLSNSVKSKLLPIIEIPGVPWDYVNERSAKTTAEHVKAFVKKLAECWNVPYPIVIDANLVEEEMGNGVKVMEYILNDLRLRGIDAIPTIRFDDTDTYLKSLVPLVEAPYDRACLRVNGKESFDLDWDTELPELLSKLDLSHEHIDLVLDFRDIKSDDVSIYAQNIKLNIKGAIPLITKYKTFTVAMTAFPENLSDHNADSMEEIPRAEWAVWKLLNASSLKRCPTFGDYGISSSEMKGVDPRLMQMSASIRYTYKDSWVIVKGRSVKKHSFDQFYRLAKALVDSKYFYGEKFSWGDKLIFEKSEGRGGTGNATTWREIGTNHHISAVVSQVIASQSAS